MGTLQTQGKMIEGFSVHHLSSTTIYTLQSNPLVYIFLVTSSFSLLLEISYERFIKICAASEFCRLFSERVYFVSRP